MIKSEKEQVVELIRKNRSIAQSVKESSPRQYFWHLGFADGLEFVLSMVDFSIEEDWDKNNGMLEE